MEKEKSWFKGRGYMHVTNKINPVTDKSNVYKLVTTPSLVAKHAFYPLLHKKIPQRRYKIIGYDEANNPIRGHKKNKGRKSESTKKLRPIHYATHIDAQIYAYYSQEIIQKRYEEYLNKNPALSDCISAYRRIPIKGGGSGNKNNIHFAKEAFDYIQKRGECCALAFDIESFFTNLNHKHLKKAWCKLLGTKALPKDHYNIYKSITNYSYILLDNFRTKRGGFDEEVIAENRKQGVHAFFTSPHDFRKQIKDGKIQISKNQYKGDDGKIRGIPQGLPISAMLANLYLLEFDKAVFQKVVKDSGGFYRRYSDDIVVVCSKEQYEGLMRFVVSEIEKYKLKISASKTEICFFSHTKKAGKAFLQSTKLVNGKEKIGFPFRYLGFEFYGDKVLIKSSNLSKFYRRMKYAIKTKVKRLRKYKERYLLDEAPLYKRKLYRLYTQTGMKSRNMNMKVTRYVFDENTSQYIPIRIDVDRRFRGNYFAYIERAARIMEEPAIKQQMNKSWKIFKKYLDQELENTKK